jgi:rod shape-determining protein MreC
MYASVIGWDPNSWYSTITINRGSDQGIEVNMAVVTKDGLLGRVTQVFSDHSTVMTIIDRQSAVAAVLERSRDNGVLKGATDQESAEPLCSLYYLSFGAALVPGDQVLTSGMGGIIPRHSAGESSRLAASPICKAMRSFRLMPILPISRKF